MKPRKKNTFFTFIFSFIPGIAEMYMGFMKSGISLLAAFVVPVLITGMIRGADYIALLSGIVYCISFFHARNIATAPDDEFSKYEDKFIWDEYFDMSGISQSTYRKCLAIALIFVGACGVWSLFRDDLLIMCRSLSMQGIGVIENVVDSVPGLVFSVLIIIFGIMLIKEKKKELIEEKDDGVDDN